jgi:hypothetical protein
MSYTERAFGDMLIPSGRQLGVRRLLRGDTLIPAFDFVEGRSA